MKDKRLHLSQIIIELLTFLGVMLGMGAIQAHASTISVNGLNGSNDY